MNVSLQVLYPIGGDTYFDYDYYVDEHFSIVNQCVGDLIKKVFVTKGKAGGPGVPAGYHAIATIVFEDKDALNGALPKLGPALSDIPNFTNAAPQMLIGEVILQP